MTLGRVHPGDVSLSHVKIYLKDLKKKQNKNNDMLQNVLSAVPSLIFFHVFPLTHFVGNREACGVSLCVWH